MNKYYPSYVKDRNALKEQAFDFDMRLYVDEMQLINPHLSVSTEQKIKGEAWTPQNKMESLQMYRSLNSRDYNFDMVGECIR